MAVALFTMHNVNSCDMYQATSTYRLQPPSQICVTISRVDVFLCVIVGFCLFYVPFYYDKNMQKLDCWISIKYSH